MSIIRKRYLGRLVIWDHRAGYVVAAQRQAQNTKIVGVWLEKNEIGIIVDVYYENDDSESVSSTLYAEVLFGEKKLVKVPLTSVTLKT